MVVWEVYARRGLVSEHLDALDKKTHYFSLSSALYVVPLLESLEYHVGSYCTQTNLLHLSIHLFVLKNSQNGKMSSNVYLKYLAWLKTYIIFWETKSVAPGAAVLQMATVSEGMCAVLSHELARLAGVKWRVECFLRLGGGR